MKGIGSLRTKGIMSKILYATLCLAIGLLVGNPARAQSADSLSVLLLKSNFEEALVFADSQYVGRVEEQLFRLEKFSGELRLVPPKLDSWSISPQVASIDLAEGDTLEIEINFPFHYKVESVPYEASVYWEKVDERVLLGATPLLYTSEDPLRGMLLVTRDGYEPVRLTPGEKIWNYHAVDLVAVSDDIEIAERYWRPEKRSNRWIDFAAGGVAVVSGILAIRYKTKANRRFDRYALSGDPELRSGFERYDRYSAISLGAMQAGIGVLAIRFVIK